MKNQFKDKMKGVYFLDNGEEVKIILSTMPHDSIYIKNCDGVLKTSKYYSFDYINKKEQKYLKKDKN